MEGPLTERALMVELLREPVRRATWIAIAVALGGIAIMVSDKSGGVLLKGSEPALGNLHDILLIAENDLDVHRLDPRSSAL